MGIFVLVCLYEAPSLLEQRFKKTNQKNTNFVENVFTNLFVFLKPVSKKINSENISKSKKLLLQAGFASSEDDVINFETKRLVNSFIAGIFLLFLLFVAFSKETLIVVLIAQYLVYKWPEIILKNIIKARQKEMEKYLPDAIDLLSICIRAGLGLEAAFQRVADEFGLTSKTVSSEFARLNKDILSGLNREDAYKNLILRNNNQDLQSFVALLIQADRLGTSVSQSLNAFCDTMRTRKRQRIEELAQQASTKMTIPLVVFMLPSIFIIIMYPALQKIMQNLGHG